MCIQHSKGRRKYLVMPAQRDMLAMYYRMNVTRFLNNELVDLKNHGKIYGPIHHTTGQEAIGIGVGATLREDDYIISNHRGYPHWIGKGIDLKKLTTEIFGKAGGCCKGKGGEMLMTDLSKGILSTTIIGAGLPIATGLGLSFKMRKTDQLVVCYFGDGAANTGAFHESLNFAALHSLPVIFLCENNQWALSIKVTSSTSVRDIARRAIAYDIEGFIVDGNDVLDIYDLLVEIGKNVREGKGPVLVEAKTYRLCPFSTNDRQSGYQPDEEIKRWMAKDPIARFREQLLLLDVGKEAEIRAEEERARHDAHDAVTYGQEADYPATSALYEDLYA